MHIPYKHGTTGTTIFSIMSALAAEHQAVNLSQGFPDFPIDPLLADLLSEAAQSSYNQYAPMPGLPLLREAIAQDFRKRYGLELHPDSEITITPGATYGIYTAFTSFLQKGDEVIVIEPAYDSYIPNIEMNGAKAVPVVLSYPDFRMDWEQMRQAISPKTKAIILNTPHNPTGAIWSPQDWQELADVVRGTDILLISDEVYEQLIFDGCTHLSVWHHEELRQRSFAVFSFGKVCNNTGWKIGYVIAPTQLTNAFRHIHQYLCFSVNTPAQYALARYLQSDNLPDIGKMMQEKRDYFLELMKGLPFSIRQPASGSYFQLAGYEQISDKNDVAFAQWLTKEYGVATIPLSPFYRNRKDDKLVRFCFAKQEATLKAAIANLSGL